MSTFNSGDIVFIMHNDSWLSKSIAWFMQSKWSHSAIVYGDTHGKTMLIETSDVQVTLNDLDRYLSNPHCTVEVWRFDGDINGDEVVTNAYSLNGKIYGYLKLLGCGIRRLFRRAGFEINTPLVSQTICKDVVTHAYLGMKQSPFGNDSAKLDTEEVYQLVLESREFKKVF